MKASQLFAVLFAVGCALCFGSEAGRAANADPLVNQTLQNYAPVAIQVYAQMALTVYAEGLGEAKSLQDAVKALVEKPSEERLEAARQAWIAARKTYLQSEVFQLSGGPLETEGGVGNLLNAWPIDPAYVDRGKDRPDTGIVNHPDIYPSITSDLLASLNQRGGAANVSTGFHVIEFLLWGEGTAAGGGRRRLYTDFVEGTTGTAPNAGRRGQYLITASALLVQHLERLVNEWSSENEHNYRTRFLALPPEEAVKKILTGMIRLGGVELAGEKEMAAFNGRSQNAEQSRFSDTSHQDFIYSAQGLANVCFGRFIRANGEDGTSGPCIYAILLKASASHPLHPSVGAIRLTTAVENMLAELQKAPDSFHAAMRGEDGEPAREETRRGLESVRAVAEDLADLGRLGLQIEFGNEIPAFANSLADSSIECRVILQYANLALAVYEDSLEGARNLKTALQTFTDKPSPETLAAARKSWLQARTPYSQSEVMRFYAGPIDGENGPEGLINAWPIDEAYIDYVAGQPKSGIINDLEHYPAINTELLVSLNQKDGEANVSTGYHAIEFLLWGQDFNANGPGQRPCTDYLEGANSTAPQPKRRSQYLLAAADLLVRNLEHLVHEWSPGEAANYRAQFLSLAPSEAIKNILTGLGMLSAVELSGERMMVALDTQVQKEEQSCFSDNTNNDIIDNVRGIANVFYGCYRRVDGRQLQGPGIYDLAKLTWAAEPQTLNASMEKMLVEVNRIPAPFDQAILGDDTAPGRRQINAAINSLTAFAEDLASFGNRLGLKINITSLKDGDE